MDGGTAATAFSHNQHLDSPLCHAPPSHLPPNVDCRVLLPPPPTAAHRRQHPDIGIAPPTRHRPATSTATAQAVEATPTRSCRRPTDAPTPWRRRQNAPTSPADAPARTRRPENAARRQVAHPVRPPSRSRSSCAHSRRWVQHRDIPHQNVTSR